MNFWNFYPPSHSNFSNPNNYFSYWLIFLTDYEQDFKHFSCLKNCPSVSKNIWAFVINHNQILHLNLFLLWLSFWLTCTSEYSCFNLCSYHCWSLSGLSSWTLCYGWKWVFIFALKHFILVKLTAKSLKIVEIFCLFLKCVY